MTLRTSSKWMEVAASWLAGWQCVFAVVGLGDWRLEIGDRVDSQRSGDKVAHLPIAGCVNL